MINARIATWNESLPCVCALELLIDEFLSHILPFRARSNPVTGYVFKPANFAEAHFVANGCVPFPALHTRPGFLPRLPSPLIILLFFSTALFAMQFFHSCRTVHVVTRERFSANSAQVVFPSVSKPLARLFVIFFGAAITLNQVLAFLLASATNTMARGLHPVVVRF